MKTPKEKAKELINKFFFTKFSVISMNPKQCALICCEEIIKVTLEDPYNRKNNRSNLDKQYWQEVKQEIEKL